ncbi:TIGR04086 family membrane protein [Nocardia camponoti]|uniref:Uncharacterized protein n=1 Tax=Nocardia camponoti TaxID=1616106 RepID=A0A917QEJ5_9NOCA|nr:TIGR04086 family membrane protein [Nocardia camponoti]GGK46065.1 hypothetical protein GCM10011591_16880 [Nocardia camponoti]
MVLRWLAKLGWLVGLLFGLFMVMVAITGYFMGIDHSDNGEIGLAVALFVLFGSLSGISIWRLAASDKRKRYQRGYQFSQPNSDVFAHQPVLPLSYPSLPSYPHPQSPFPANPPSQPDLWQVAPAQPQTPPPAPIIATVAQTPDHITATRSTNHWLPTGIPYVTAPSSVLGSPADLDRDTSSTRPTRVREAVRETIAIEGPIEQQQLVARVAARFGVVEPSPKQRIAVLSQVPETLTRATPFGVFVWPSDIEPANWIGFRFTSPGITRPLDTISGEEIVNTITHLAAGRGHTFDDLVWATLNQFAHQRTTAAEARIEACLELAVRRGRLVRGGDGRYRAR